MKSDWLGALWVSSSVQITTASCYPYLTAGKGWEKRWGGTTEGNNDGVRGRNIKTEREIYIGEILRLLPDSQHHHVVVARTWVLDATCVYIEPQA